MRIKNWVKFNENQEIDDVLDKINRSGMDSLTKKEISILNGKEFTPESIDIDYLKKSSTAHTDNMYLLKVDTYDDYLDVVDHNHLLSTTYWVFSPRFGSYESAKSAFYAYKKLYPFFYLIFTVNDDSDNAIIGFSVGDKGKIAYNLKSAPVTDVLDKKLAEVGIDISQLNQD